MRLALILFFALPAYGQRYVFPLFADGTFNGTSYRSVLRINKTSVGGPVQCTLIQRNTSASFTGVDGSFYSADVFDGGASPPAMTEITLDQYLPWEILRTNAQSPLKTGYATLFCSAPVEAQLQFSLSDSQNNKLGEATVMPAVKGRSFQFLVDRRTGARLGFSLVNDSATAGQFTLIVRDRFNYEIDRIYGDIEAWSQVSRFADELLALPPNFVGTVELIGAGTESYAIGFEFTGAVFTTIQPVVQSGGSK